MQTITNIPTDAPQQLPPLNIHPRWRFVRISWFFLRVIAHVFFFDILLNRWWLTRWYVRRTAMARWVNIARRFRGLAVHMGGVLIKLGQFLSARADILPAQITDELAGLQDEVPPAPLAYVLATIMEELGASPDQLFARFDPVPVAAASFGQVFFGKLHDGREVAIKVQRPKIDQIVEVDLRAVEWAVRIIRNYPAIKRRADLLALFEEFKRVLILELNYIQEAHNAERIRQNFADVPGVYIPEPYTDLSRTRVLIMERISGIKISDIAALDHAGVNRSEIAQRFYRTYLKQWFFDGIFHADPHPGNLFVRIDQPPDSTDTSTFSYASCTLILIDFGMVGHLGPQLMQTLRTGTVAIALNDPERFVQALDDLGVILPHADRQPIIQAAALLFHHAYDRKMNDLTNMALEGVFNDIEHLIRDMPFQFPQDFIYLGRSISMASGLTTALDPQINLFDTLRPFAQEVIASEHNNDDWLKNARVQLTDFAKLVATLPYQMDHYFKAANRGELQMRVDFSRLERSMRRMERATSRLAGGIISSGFFIGGVLLRINGFTNEASWAWVAAALAIVWTFWPRWDR